MGDIDAEQTATTTLEFTMKPTFPTGTPVTTAFAVVQRAGGSPLPREELTPRDNSTSVTALTKSDRAALVALYNATDGPNWRNNTNWLSDEPLDTWEGVTTDDRGRVIQLHLVEQRLNGQLPVELGDLTRLKWLNIARNPDLTGDIPPEMAQLTNLEVLYLWENDLTGTVPTWMGDLSELRLVSLGHNRLTGPIPGELRNLTRLETLYLAGNELTGVIPDWMGGLTTLTRLFLYDNQLSGTIPSSLANLEDLEYLHLSGNSLIGCLPPGLTEVLDNDLDQLGLRDCGGSTWKRFVRLEVFENFDTYIPQLSDFGDFDVYVDDGSYLISGLFGSYRVVGFRTWLYHEGSASYRVGIIGNDGVALYSNGTFVAGRGDAEGPMSYGTLNLNHGWNKIEALVYNGPLSGSLKLEPILSTLGVMDADAHAGAPAPAGGN